MNTEIAVFFDHAGQTISLEKEGTIGVFDKQGDNWKVINEIPFKLDKTKGLAGIRKQLEGMSGLLGECKTFIAKKITGLPYAVLDMMGYTLWELDGRPEDFLEFVRQKEEEELTKMSYAPEAEPAPGPVQTGDEGYYSIDLKQLQQHKNITSKQALLSFLREGAFYQLDITCGHIPPWFEREFEKLGLTKEEICIGTNEYKVIVKNELYVD